MTPTRLAFSAMLVLGLALLPAGAAAEPDTPTVQTTSGPVIGVVEDGIEVFRGIPKPRRRWGPAAG